MHAKLFAFNLIAIASIFPLITDSQMYDLLLSREDIELEISEKNGAPALSTPLTESEHSESYNEWLCFGSDDVELLRAEVDNEFKGTLIPILAASTPGHSFEISIFGETQEENDEIFARWKQLLEGSRKICAFAAYLNDIDPVDNMPASTWIISKFKTENGYWHYQNYSETEDESENVPLEP